MKTTFKAGDKVVVTIDGHGIKAGDVCEFFRCFTDDVALVTHNGYQYCVDLKDIKPYYYTNSAIINGRIYPIPHDKTDQVKKLVDPGMPKWWDLPALELPTVLYKLYKAADYVNEGWKPDWEDERQKKYMLYYDGNEFLASPYCRFSCGVPVFKSTAAALRAVELFRANGDYDELVRFYQS